MDDLEIETCGGVDRGSSSTSAPAAATTTNSILEVKVDARTEPKPYPKRRMQKVPLILRKDETLKGCFDPRVVSLGPYHHGKKELQMVERIKPTVAKLFIKCSGRDMNEFRKKVRGIVNDARSCYLEGTTDKYPDDYFAEMMLLDGIFVLAFIECITPGYEDQTIKEVITKHLGLFAIYPLATDVTDLLENQVPFQVLESLMSLNSKHRKLTEMLDKLLDANLDSRDAMRQDKKEHRSTKRTDDTKQPIHYLEYYWLWANELTQPNHTRGTSESSTRPLVDYFYSFKSVAELKAKGIYARRGSDYNHLLFTFKSFLFFAVLEIPRIMLDPQYIRQISNLIAYECSPDNPNNLPTVAYVNFMKCLINTTEDVKELRANDILFSTSMSDEEVVKMFNSIPTTLVEDFRIYDEVKKKIREHYTNKAKTWFAELIHNYFSDPWTFIAFVAATALIIMSFLQTYFTIFPHK